MEPKSLMQLDLAAYSKPDLRALASSARALAARADQEIAARSTSFPSQIAPQLVTAWLPLRDAGPALSVSSVWRAASEPMFKIVAARRGTVRESADIPWSEVVRLSIKRVEVLDNGELFTTHHLLAKALGVFDKGWVMGRGTSEEYIESYGNPVPDPADRGRHYLNDGDVGVFIAEVRSPDENAVAFRADKNGSIYVVGRRGLEIRNLDGEAVD